MGGYTGLASIVVRQRSSKLRQQEYGPGHGTFYRVFRWFIRFVLFRFHKIINKHPLLQMLSHCPCSSSCLIFINIKQNTFLSFTLPFPSLPPTYKIHCLLTASGFVTIIYYIPFLYSHTHTHTHKHQSETIHFHEQGGRQYDCIVACTIFLFLIIICHVHTHTCGMFQMNIKPINIAP